MIKTIITYLYEILQSPTDTYGSYFYDDIATYLDIDWLLSCPADEEILNHLHSLITNNHKYDSLLNCKSKNDVKSWLDNITSYIIFHINENELIYEYLN